MAWHTPAQNEPRTQLVDIIAEKRIGDVVTLTYIRDGKEETAKVALEALPDQK